MESQKTDGVAFNNRRSARLRDYNYGQPGIYFVTVVAQNRRCLFGRIESEKVIHSQPGRMVKATWEEIPARFPFVELDKFTLMPNHIHGLVVINSLVGAPLVGAHPSYSRQGPESNPSIREGAVTKSATTLAEVIGAFKSITTVEYIRGVRERDWPVFDRSLWQRGYYDHIIRNEKDLQRVRQYIMENPAKWSLDAENPATRS